MEYFDALRWLRTLPDFERTGQFSSRPDVEPVRALLRELGDPHAGRPTLHIAGSKGKGSTGVMIEAVLRAAGPRTGFYVSPHLHRYTERIRIDGQPSSRAAFAAALTAAREAIEAVAPRFPERSILAFDALTVAAFVAFRDAASDAQIIEVGLGGLLDSTNVFDAKDVCVITPISLEHTAILGNTVAEIAAQKAGIIAPGSTVIVAPQRESALDVIREASRQRDAMLVEVAQTCQLTPASHTLDGQDFKLKTPRASYFARLPLLGRHQLDNAATAIIACEELARRRGFELTPEHVRDGLSRVVWPARFELLRRKPLVIVDGAHNGDSARRLVAALREYAGVSHAHVMFGTLADKDAQALAEAIAPVAAEAYIASWPNPRAADVRALAEVFRSFEMPVLTFASLPQAIDAATGAAGERGAVVAFGALAFAAAVREYVLGIESDMIDLALAAREDAGRA